MLDDWEDLSAAEKEACRLIAYESLIGFTRVMFRFVKRQKFSINWHHILICDKLEDVYFGRSKRVIFNLAPGGTKTELVCICFIAWTIFRNYEDARIERQKTGAKQLRHTRSLPVSYSDSLIKLNTGAIKEILLSAVFQYMCPVALGSTRKGESDWKMTDASGATHEVFGVSLSGQVTGRRAGFLVNHFSGVLVIDDPMPPKDSSSFARKDEINSKLNKVVRSRLMHDDVPIVMVQQRVATGDQTDFLTGDKALDDWELIKIPALITPEYFKSLAPKLRAKIAASTGYTGGEMSYWEQQVPTAFLKRVRENDVFLFSSQYQQAPDEAMMEGVYFRKEIAAAYAGGRIGKMRIDTSIPVCSIWDLGQNDLMVLWLYQKIRHVRRFIGCYGNHDLSIEHYVNWMIDYRDKFGIRYGNDPDTHQAPHDIVNRGKLSSVSDLEVASRAGINFKTVERPRRKNDPITATRRIWPVIEIDEELCSMDAVNPNDKQKGRWGLDALKKYRRIWDAENEVFANEPVHDWTSHWTEAFLLVGSTYQEPHIKSEEPPPMVGSGWSI